MLKVVFRQPTARHLLVDGLTMVTLAGRAHVAQVGVDMLASVGLADLLAFDEDVYLALGVSSPATMTSSNSARHCATAHAELAEDECCALYTLSRTLCGNLQ
jgi:predicted O-linked N-acetylglucosamine transferase (SPINDLY family)